MDNLIWQAVFNNIFFNFGEYVYLAELSSFI